jgi:hypothetical protein
VHDDLVMSKCRIQVVDDTHIPTGRSVAKP